MTAILVHFPQFTIFIIMTKPIKKQGAVHQYSQAGKYYCITYQNPGMSKMPTIQNVKSATFPTVRRIMTLRSPRLLLLLLQNLYSCFLWDGVYFPQFNQARAGRGRGWASVNLFPVSVVKGLRCRCCCCCDTTAAHGPWATTADRQQALLLRLCCCCIVAVWTQGFVGMIGMKLAAGARVGQLFNGIPLSCDSSDSFACPVN